MGIRPAGSTTTTPSRSASIAGAIRGNIWQISDLKHAEETVWRTFGDGHFRMVPPRRNG